MIKPPKTLQVTLATIFPLLAASVASGQVPSGDGALTNSAEVSATPSPIARSMPPAAMANAATGGSMAGGLDDGTVRFGSAVAEASDGHADPGMRADHAGAMADRVGAAGDMIGFSHADGSGTQTITLVDTKKSWMAVYHIDRSGKIRLVSSRPIDADFSLQLNATSPLPDEIRGIGRARR